MTCQCKLKTVRQPVATPNAQALRVISTTICTSCKKAHPKCNIIDGFLPRQYELNLNQKHKIQDIARRIITSSIFHKNPAIALRFTTHLDGIEFRNGQFELARHRANSTVRELKKAIESLSPKSSNQIQFKISIAYKFTPLSIEASKNRRVEICLPQEDTIQIPTKAISSINPKASFSVIKDTMLIYKNNLRETDWNKIQEYEGGVLSTPPNLYPSVNFPHQGVATATLNPNFGCNVAVSKNLQKQIDNLMNTVYPKLKSKVKIALVGMSNGATTSCPSFAAWRENENFFGASTPKIAPLYALFQLKYELNSLLILNPSISNIVDLEKAMLQKWSFIKGLGVKPQIRKLFQLNNNVISFKTDIQAILNNFSHSNSGLSKLISLLGYAYIGSLMLQSGLFQPNKSKKRNGQGIWLMSSYGKYIGTWANSPFGGLGGGTQNITAKSVVTFFTLLAKNKLAYSNDILNTLSGAGGCVIWGGVPNIRASKCGYYGNYKIDAFLYDDGSGKKFVMSLLTKDLTQTEYLNLRTSIISLF